MLREQPPRPARCRARGNGAPPGVAQVVQAQDYYAFGAAMEGWSFSISSYRFGFNGKGNDTDWGPQLIQDYGFRLYNPALGRFLTVDPFSRKFPMLTPYQFASNTPIMAIDLDGLEAKLAITLGHDVHYRGSLLQKITNGDARHYHSSEANLDKLISILKAASDSDPAGISFLAVFSHGDGYQGTLIGVEGFSSSISIQDYKERLRNEILEGNIKFHQEAMVYFGGCGLGNCPIVIDENGVNEGEGFSKITAMITGASTIGGETSVSPYNESNGNMVYTVFSHAKDNFREYSKDGSFKKIGPLFDLIGSYRATATKVKDYRPLRDYKFLPPDDVGPPPTEPSTERDHSYRDE